MQVQLLIRASYTFAHIQYGQEIVDVLVYMSEKLEGNYLNKMITKNKVATLLEKLTIV